MDGKIPLLLASCFLLFGSYSHALTRAEIIDRFRAVPIVKLDGLVQVVPDCPAEMRRAYQLPIAGHAADTCHALYAAEMAKPKRFVEPGIIVYIGDVRTNVTNVVTRLREREDGSKFTRIYLPAPGFSDRRALTLAIARAYFWAVHGKEIDDKEAWHALMSASPELRAAETCGRLADWSERGVYVDGMDDEDYLRLSRKVLLPGRLTKHELNEFASRLYLYPLLYDVPFAGKHTSVDFETAVGLREQDQTIRLSAFVKSKQILIYGAGRGEGLQAVASAYAEFLTELARAEKTDGELLALLDTANGKLRTLVVSD